MWPLMCPGYQSILVIRGYHITSMYSNALQTSQTCSFAKWCHILHLKVAFEALRWCARCGIKSVHGVPRHLSLNQRWKTLLFEYLAAIRYTVRIVAAIWQRLCVLHLVKNSSTWQSYEKGCNQASLHARHVSSSQRTRFIKTHMLLAAVWYVVSALW